MQSLKVKNKENSNTTYNEVCLYLYLTLFALKLRLVMWENVQNSVGKKKIKNEGKKSASHALLTGWIDVVGEEEVELSDWDVDVVWVDAEAGMKTIRRLFQSLAVRALQGNGLEQDHLDQVQTPHLNSINKLILFSLFRQSQVRIKRTLEHFFEN